jgi:L-ascorbate metabolism protein UlaG (beta-lactamase superfamily)
MVQHDGIRADWLGYATLRLETPAPASATTSADGDASTVVYCDPGRYGVLAGEWPPGGADGDADHHPRGPAVEPGDADLVCVTHDHHYDPAAIRRVATKGTTLVVFEGVNTHHIERDVERPVDLSVAVRRVDAAADIAVGDVVLRTTAAYNNPDGPHVRANGEPYHPEGFGCGFHLTLPSPVRGSPGAGGPSGDGAGGASGTGGVRVFWPGDTDVLEGHAELDVDLFCPPIGGAFTMDRHGAAELAAAMGPELVLPVHYNTFDALTTDSRAFAADVAEAGVPVALSEGWPADLF